MREKQGIGAYLKHFTMKKNIYWEYHCENAEIEWIDDTTVEINGKHLKVITDSYDWRNN